jgi:hypothetical protein
MTVPQLSEFNLYWKKNPPLHMMVAAYLGIGKEKEPEGDFGELMSMFPGK